MNMENNNYITKEALASRWATAWKSYISAGPSDLSQDMMFYSLYVYMFGPGHLHCFWRHNTYRKLLRTDVGHETKYQDGSEMEQDRWDDFIYENTVENIIKFYDTQDIPYITFRWDRDCILISGRRELFFFYGNGYMISQDEFLSDEINSLFVFSDVRHHVFQYMVRKSDGRYTTIERTITEEEVSVEDNYNDDIPYNEFIDFIRDDDEYGLAIMRGIPGTGKSSLLRHFISVCPEREFIYLDQSCFDALGEGAFIEELSEHEGAVIILEDCEVLLKKRMEGVDNKLAAILNLSDGILGDGFRLHFICTFNTNLNNIDPALLRKGRLKINYEFKQLTAEKTAHLAELLDKDVPEGTELTLGDIYNYDEVVEYGSKRDKTMGFRL